MGLILLTSGYTASVALLAPHAPVKISPGWSGDLSMVTVSSSSLGKVRISSSYGGMNLTIIGNSTSYSPDTFYGVELTVSPPVNSAQLQFFDVWMKTNSVYVAGTVAVQLDTGWNTTIIQKTYNSGDWHEEVVLLQPFVFPPGHPIVKLTLGFTVIPSPQTLAMSAVEFSRPSFDYSNPTPRVYNPS